MVKIARRFENDVTSFNNSLYVHDVVNFLFLIGPQLMFTFNGLLKNPSSKPPGNTFNLINTSTSSTSTSTQHNHKKLGVRLATNYS